MAGAIPDIVIRLVADVDEFIRAWDRAADAAERAAARIRAASQAAGDGPDPSRFRDLNAELERLSTTARRAADSIREHGNASRRAGQDADDLSGRLRNLGDGMTRVGSSATSASGGMKPMPIVMGVIGSILPGIVAGIFALGAALTGIVIAAGVAALGAKGLGQAFDGLQRTIAPLQRQLDSVFRAGLAQEMIKLGQTVTSQLTPAFKEVASAIVGLVKDTTEWIRSAEGISTIKTAMGGVRDLVKALSPGVKALVQIFVEFAAAAAPAMGKIGDAISSVIVSLRDMFREAQKSGQLQKIFEAGAEAIKGFGEILKGVIMILMEMASQGGLPAAEAMKKFGKALQEAAPTIGAIFASCAKLANILATVIEVVAKVVAWFDSFKIAGKSLSEVFLSLSNPISMAIGFFEMFKNMFPEAGKEIDKFIGTVKKGFDDFPQVIAKGVAKATTEITKWAIKTYTDIKQGIDKTIAAVKAWWDKTSADVKAGIDKVTATIKAWWDKQVADFKAGVDKILTTVKEWWDKTREDVQEGIDKVIAAVVKMKDDLVDSIKELPDKFMQAGKDMIDGLIKGLASGAAKLVKMLVDMVMDGVRAMKAALGIASPSRLMGDEVGEMIPAGISQGITKGAPAMHAALTRAMRALPVTANVALGGMGAGRGAAIGTGLGRQVIEVKLAVGSGGDGAVGTMIGGLARRGQLKITANAVVGGR